MNARKDAPDARTRAALGRRASAASGTHADRRTRRNRSRADQRRNAVREDGA